MCERPATNSSVSEDESKIRDEGQGSSKDKQDGVKSGLKRERDETEDEKRKRRKAERKKRTMGRRKAAGKLVSTPATSKKVLNHFTQTWERENVFVTSVMQCLPEVRNPGLYAEEEERTEEYLNQFDEAPDEVKEKEQTQKFFAKVRRKLKSQGLEPTVRATSYQELKERLQRKISELAQPPNEKKREKKLQKKLARAKEEKSNKGKKLISQTASAAATNGVVEDASSIKSESSQEKAPLKKRPVVKSNGEIVYSKFDFISNDARTNGPTPGSTIPGKKAKGNLKQTPDELLKKAEKHENKISRLATQGKKSEAADLAESQKWETALKRADGQKVRDDPYLLKKTIKKQEKQKQVTKKKWKERVERVEKQKEVRQQKRQTNIQTRMDDKKKRVKKQLRKRGRIA